jgi:hypothetical protein
VDEAHYQRRSGAGARRGIATEDDDDDNDHHHHEHYFASSIVREASECDAPAGRRMRLLADVILPAIGVAIFFLSRRVREGIAP